MNCWRTVCPFIKSLRLRHGLVQQFEFNHYGSIFLRPIQVCAHFKFESLREMTVHTSYKRSVCCHQDIRDSYLDKPMICIFHKIGFSFNYWSTLWSLKHFSLIGNIWTAISFLTSEPQLPVTTNIWKLLSDVMMLLKTDMDNKNPQVQSAGKLQPLLRWKQPSSSVLCLEHFYIEIVPLS